MVTDVNNLQRYDKLIITSFSLNIKLLQRKLEAAIYVIHLRKILV